MSQGVNTVKIKSVLLRIVFCSAVRPGQISDFKKLIGGEKMDTVVLGVLSTTPVFGLI